MLPRGPSSSLEVEEARKVWKMATEMLRAWKRVMEMRKAQEMTTVAAQTGRLLRTLRLLLGDSESWRREGEWVLWRRRHLLKVLLQVLMMVADFPWWQSWMQGRERAQFGGRFSCEQYTAFAWRTSLRTCHMRSFLGTLCGSVVWRKKKI